MREGRCGCRDKADEENTVEKKGMDGFLDVLQSAMAEPLPGTGVDEGGAAAEAEAEAAAAAAAKLQKRADLALEKRLAAMDAGELKRWKLEQQLRTGRGAEGRSAAASASAADDGAEGEAAGAEDAQAAAGAVVPQAAKKRAAEDKIAAARERAKQRKLQKG